MIVRLTDALLALLAASLAAAGGGYWLGLEEGRSDVKAAHDSDQVAALNRVIDTTNGLIQQANTASADLRAQTAARAEYDLKTSKELKDALIKSAGSRAGCRYDVVSLRLLEAARERANKAAASGVLDTVPAAAGAKR